MGLTIHYSLRTRKRSLTYVRQLVAELRNRALELPFTEVGEIVELTGPACEFERCDRQDPNVWLLIQAAQHVGGATGSYRAVPTHVIAFETTPGEGSEPANFGLCRYPSAIEVHDRRDGLTRKMATKLAGWRWSSFCKTQYACRTERGGVANFLKCHLLVVAMLRRAGSMGVLGQVYDEGGFWESSDPEALAKQVGGWNADLATIFAGDDAPSEFCELANLKRLEAAATRIREPGRHDRLAS
jgi:hypothetical protein